MIDSFNSDIGPYRRGRGLTLHIYGPDKEARDLLAAVADLSGFVLTAYRQYDAVLPTHPVHVCIQARVSILPAPHRRSILAPFRAVWFAFIRRAFHPDQQARRPTRSPQ